MKPKHKPGLADARFWVDAALEIAKHLISFVQRERKRRKK